MSHTPLNQVSALAPEFYTRDDTFAFEMRDLLPAYWQLLGSNRLLEEPGDVIVREIVGAPIIVVRSDDGDLNGFYNICQHRAGPLATCDQRGLKRLRCAYHGWAYDFQGNLRAAPEMKEATNFDQTQVNLTPIDVVEWNGLVFARLARGPDFETVYDGVEKTAGKEALADLTHHTQLLYEVDCNWKVYVDNFLEGYHLPFVHPGLTQLVTYKDYTTELGPWWSLQRSPVEESGPYAAGEGLYFFVFPNTMLNIMPGRLQTNRVVPTGLTTCQVRVRLLLRARRRLSRKGGSGVFGPSTRRGP